MARRFDLDTRLTLIGLLAITFVSVQWGSRDVRFAVVILFAAIVAFLAGARAARSKLVGRDGAWMAALQEDERFRRKKAAEVEHTDIDQAVQWERGANAVQMASQAALARFRE